jgi:hypothetical protein
MLRNVRGFMGFTGSLRHVLVALGATLLTAVACGDSEKPAPSGEGPGVSRGGSGAVGGTGGNGARGGSSGSAGTTGGEGGANSLAPCVTVTSPEALGHPDDGPVLVDAEVVVTCEVTKSGESAA